jgi:hypothetical protein
MKKFIVMTMLLIMTAFAYADISSGLTEIQKAELALQAAKMKENAIPTSKKVMDASDAALDVSKKWAGVGKELAVGIVATAKELGVAANEFAATPLGKLTTVMLVWNYMGKDILGIIMSLTLLFIGLPLIWYVYRMMITDNVVYEEKVGIFGRKYSQIKSYRTISDEPFFFTTAGYILASIACIIVALNFYPH